MELPVGADRAEMEDDPDGARLGSHRVVDAEDPPRELSGLAWGAFVCLGAVGLLELVRIVFALELRSAAGGDGDVFGAYRRFSTWAGLGGFAVLVSAAVFIAWFFRAYKNLRRLGLRGLRYANGWAIGSWFVPILNLFRPKQIANDIWRGSERGVGVSAQWRQVEVPPLVHWWWALFLAQGVLVEIGQRVVQTGYAKLTPIGGGSFDSGLSQIKAGTIVDVLGALTGVAGVAVAILVVGRVTRRLDTAREEALVAGTMPTDPAPPTEGRIQCPECAEWIQPQARVCRFCGHRLTPAGE